MDWSYTHGGRLRCSAGGFQGIRMIRLLLDTHALLWALGDVSKLSAQSRSLIEDTQNACFFSVVSFWEIAIKVNIGKLTLDKPIDELPSELTALNVKLLGIETSP